MKKILLLTAMLSFTFNAVHAQISSEINRHQPDPAPTGSDFWFALPSNQWGQNLGGKYVRIYITSRSNCTASVSSNGSTTNVPVSDNAISTFNVPEFWEMESSGIVENKGIHVYSSEAAVTAYFLSNNTGASEGSCIIPTSGLGTDYAVAAAGSLFEGSGSNIFDLPSECVMVANQDNTVVTITPSCNCRKSTSGNENADSSSTIVAFPKGQPFTVTLNQGQSMQLMPVLATDADNFDMTGTVVHATHPIGMIGGSMLVNLPADFPTSNFVCEMIPPISRWGKTYYATNFAQTPGESNNVARYLFISSEPRQTIFRSECGASDQTECIISNQYGIFWDEIGGAQKFLSSAPFLLVSYSNSSAYPDGANGNSRPAEVSIDPSNRFSKSVVFIAPPAFGNITPFNNDANIICNVNDAKNVTLDGAAIAGLSAQCIDDSFEIITDVQVSPGAHTLVSDSGIGVYLYNFGNDEDPYAWSSPDSIANLNSYDTIPPFVDSSSLCYTSVFHLSDSGMLPNSVDTQSGLSEIRIDSIFNMNIAIDPDFIEGSGADTSGYSISVIDPTQPAIANIQVFDLAGNVTTVTTTYKPDFIEPNPPIVNLGVWISGPPNVMFDTIINEGQTPFDLGVLHLRYGNVGFSIFDSIGGPLGRSPIPVGGRRIVEIQFVALQATPVLDGIIIGNTCDSISVAVIGSGQVNSLVVPNPSFAATIIPTNDGRSLEIILPADMNGPVSFMLVNVLGESVLHETFGARTQNVDASSLPRGVYFYRLTSGQISQSGKAILGE